MIGFVQLLGFRSGNLFAVEIKICYEGYEHNSPVLRKEEKNYKSQTCKEQT